MNLGPNKISATFSYVLNASGSTITLGNGNSVDWNGSAVVARTGAQTISGNKTFIGNTTIGQSAGTNYFGQSAVNNYIGQGASANYIGTSGGTNYIGDSAGSNAFGASAVNNYIGQGASANYIGASAVNNYIGESASANYIGQDAYANYIGQSAGDNYFGQYATDGNYFGESAYANYFGYGSAYNIYYGGVFGSVGGTVDVGYQAQYATFGMLCYVQSIFGQDTPLNLFGESFSHPVTNYFGSNATNIIGSGAITNTFGGTGKNNFGLTGTNNYGTINTSGSISITPPTNTLNYAGLTISGANAQSLFASLQNTSGSVSGSTDISLYNDTGAYLDIGIASSKYNGNIFSPTFNIVNSGDSYVYSTAKNLIIGTATSGDIVFFTSGTLSGNERMRITSDGSIKHSALNANSYFGVSGNNIFGSGNNTNNFGVSGNTNNFGVSANTNNFGVSANTNNFGGSQSNYFGSNGISYFGNPYSSNSYNYGYFGASSSSASQFGSTVTPNTYALGSFGVGTVGGSQFGATGFSNTFGNGLFSGPIRLYLPSFSGLSSQSGQFGEARISGSGLYFCTGTTGGWGRTFLSTF